MQLCFSVSLTKSAFKRDPRFHYLLEEYAEDGGYHYFGFNFPSLPVLPSEYPDRAIPAGWGLIPLWADTVEKAVTIRSKTLNARGETIGEKPSFRNSWPGKRCLLPVEGFFDYHRDESGKNPWYISRKDGSPFYLGGIYQTCPENLRGFPSLTFSIITVPAAGLMAEVHNEKPRMPLILTGGAAEHWLDLSAPEPAPLELGRGISQRELYAWPVDSGIFRSRRDSPQVRQKVERPGHQMPLFPEKS